MPVLAPPGSVGVAQQMAMSSMTPVIGSPPPPQAQAQAQAPAMGMNGLMGMTSAAPVDNFSAFDGLSAAPSGAIGSTNYPTHTSNTNANTNTNTTSILDDFPPAGEAGGKIINDFI